MADPYPKLEIAKKMGVECFHTSGADADPRVTRKSGGRSGELRGRLIEPLALHRLRYLETQIRSKRIVVPGPRRHES